MLYFPYSVPNLIWIQISQIGRLYTIFHHHEPSRKLESNLNQLYIVRETATDQSN